MSLQAILRRCIKKQGISNLLRRSEVFSTNNKRSFSGLLTASRRNPEFSIPKAMDSHVLKRSMSGDHSKLWPIEKIVSLALLGVIPADIMNPTVALDDILAILAVLHMIWGMEGVVADYVRPIIFGNTIPKITFGLLYLVSIITLGGLLFYNHECIGIGCTVRKFWEIQK